MEKSLWPVKTALCTLSWRRARLLEKCEEEESELTMQDPENEEIIGHKSICAAKASTMGHERKKKKSFKKSGVGDCWSP